MARIIIYSGKGGVGKTTISAASGLALAKRGYRTLVISFDLAHSLSDSFDLDRKLFDQNDGLPIKVATRLDIQEINVQAELNRHWGEVSKYLAMLISSTGVSEVIAEELAILPGMEDVVCMLYLNQYVKQKKYDVIVVDCPPTGQTISFVSMGTTIKWYMERRFGIDRALVKLAKPLAKMAQYGILPEDSYFDSIKDLYARIEGIEELLSDPKVTSVRLVTNAEKMVVKETQRAFLYFTLYGLTTDCIIVNRLLTKSTGYFSKWAETHASHLREIEEFFHPVPVVKLPLFPNEVIGMTRLNEVAEHIFEKNDPAEVRKGCTPFAFEKKKNTYCLRMPMPFAKPEEVELIRDDSNLIVCVGSFRRHIPLPRAIDSFRMDGAEVDAGELIVRFRP